MKWLLLFALTFDAQAHRLDEYLQSTLISISQHHIDLEINLTPGVAVLPLVLAVIDWDRNDRISDEEQRAYAERIRSDVGLESAGQTLPLTITGWNFPSVEEMRQGLGMIRIQLRAARTGGRELYFANRHLAPISVYLVNCLLPPTGGLTIRTQSRDQLQTGLRIEYSIDERIAAH